MFLVIVEFQPKYSSELREHEVAQLISLSFYRVHQLQTIFQLGEDENNGKQNTKDLCSLQTNSPPGRDVKELKKSADVQKFLHTV